MEQVRRLRGTKRSVINEGTDEVVTFEEVPLIATVAVSLGVVSSLVSLISAISARVIITAIVSM